MKMPVTMFVGLALLVGCSNQGGTSDTDRPSTGRGTNAAGDRGGNGVVYDRGRGPDDKAVAAPPGNGRIDRGGGVTAGTKPGSVGNAATTTNSTGATSDSTTNQP